MWFAVLALMLSYGRARLLIETDSKVDGGNTGATEDTLLPTDVGL